MHKDLSGQQFGQLYPIRFESRKPRPGWVCQCACGNVKFVCTWELRSGKVQSCGCLLRTACWKGFGEISGNYWARLKRSAAFRRIAFQISIQDGWALFLKQDRKCALTGIPLVFAHSYMNPRTKDKELQTASLDRISSHGEYVSGNVQWVHVDINYMKQDFTVERFLELCQLVASHQQCELTPQPSERVQALQEVAAVLEKYRHCFGV